MQFKNLFRMMIFLTLCTAMVYSISFNARAEEKEQQVQHESGIYYTIQKGDTLWDLSERFFDSPALWPNLWKDNRQIPNPHWIYPGEKIRLYYQTGTQQYKLIEKIEKPPEEPKKKPLIIPEYKPEPPYYYYSSIESVGFIRKEPVKPKGTIFRAKDDKVMISTGDLVYIKPAKHTMLFKGAKFIVYRTLESIRGKKYEDYISPYGIQHYLTGIVEITDTESDYAIARVIANFRDIRVNDLLMVYKPRSEKILLAESTEGILGQIITSEERDRMFGDHTIAFIDKGKQDGIKVGQFYSVFYQEKHGLALPGEPEKNIKLLTPIDFGLVLVLHTEENNSTVLVTYSEKDMYPTVQIRTPVLPFDKVK